jgi:CRP-like cAMP-binding protein
MFIGIAMVATVTAVATSFLTSRDALEETVREKKQMLASMLEYYRMPWEQQIEIIGLFPTALDAENERNFTQLVQNMPGFIVEKIEGYTRAKALSSSIPLFSELPVDVVLEVTGKLHQRFSQVNEPIIQHGDEGFEMFFLVRGIADVVVPIGGDDELVVAVLRSGAFFGEMALVQDTRRTASVIAVMPCELLVLSKPDFQELIRKHSVLRQIFVDVVFRRHNITQVLKDSERHAEDNGTGSKRVSINPVITVVTNPLSNPVELTTSDDGSTGNNGSPEVQDSESGDSDARNRFSDLQALRAQP